MRGSTRRLGAALTIGAALFIAACGGGGGGGGGPTQPPPPSVTFLPGGAAGSNSVSLQSGAFSLTTLELNVTLQAVPGLYGLAFDLEEHSEDDNEKHRQRYLRLAEAARQQLRAGGSDWDTPDVGQD